MFMRVDLPEPDGPTMATYSLPPMSRSMFRERLDLDAPGAVDLADAAHANHHSYLNETAGLTDAARRAGK